MTRGGPDRHTRLRAVTGWKEMNVITQSSRNLVLLRLRPRAAGKGNQLEPIKSPRGKFHSLLSSFFPPFYSSPDRNNSTVKYSIVRVFHFSLLVRANVRTYVHLTCAQRARARA